MTLAGIAMSFTAFGWALAHAQNTEPDFAIVVEAPGGETTIRCVRGCKPGLDRARAEPKQQARPVLRLSLHGQPVLLWDRRGMDHSVAAVERSIHRRWS
jgi:hypothetical protein